MSEVVFVPSSNVPEEFWESPSQRLGVPAVVANYENWCDENCQGIVGIGWQLVRGQFTGIVARFDKSNDAILFSLRWCGTTLPYKELDV